MTETEFAARHIVRSGSFSLAIPPQRAFAFFTPEGERAWIPDWTPEYLHPSDGTLGPGLVFRTRAGGEPTLWLVSRYDAQALEAEYVRIVPESRIGTVVVRCRGAGGEGTQVEVTYAFTGLSNAGNDVLAALTEEAYARVMSDWQKRVTAVLLASPPNSAPGVS